MTSHKIIAASRKTIAKSHRRCCRSSQPKARRHLAHQQLESRLLLAADEGSDFSLPRQSIDTVGLVGNVTAEVRWGDGTKTTVPVESPSVTNKIRFKFDYSLDTKKFFNGARKNALEEVGRSVAQYFTDSLSAISPSGPNTWQAFVCHPSKGASNQLCGVLENVSNRVRSVAANEIVVFAGARDIIGNVRGTGSSGAFTATGPQSWLNTVAGRGQSGALANPQTDVGVWGGSVSFDNGGTDWYLGKDISDIGANQVDFRTVAAHELLHVLGFGVSLPDKTSAWERLTPGSKFNGNKAKGAYTGSGAPPVDTRAHGDGPSKSHWAESIEEQGQLTLMRAAVATGERQLISRLDLAALDDLGWQVTYPNKVTVDHVEHIYGDDDDYTVEIVAKGSVFGENTKTVVANINNVAPSLTVPPTQTVVVGEQLSLPSELWEITDPGYGTTDPQSSEIFAYRIDWKDGTDPTFGEATVTQVGNESRDTIATFSATHTYADVGNYRVEVTVIDDDEGVAAKTFTVQVIEPPTLQLSLSKGQISEDDGDDAATLTVTRTGPATGSDKTISLASDDTSEVTLPGSVVIKAGETSATVGVNAKDDNLLDDTRTATLTASADGLTSGEITIDITDAEFLTATLSAEGVVENDSTSVVLKIKRSNTDTDDSLEVIASGGNPGELTMPSPIMIEAGKRTVSIRLNPVNDEDPEPTEKLAFTFTAANYQGTSIEFDLWDDEPPLFQNEDDRFDVDGKGTVTSGDALRVLNTINRRQGNSELDPESEQPDGEFVDVTGDYYVTSLDALQVINEVARRILNGESEQIASAAQVLPLSEFAGILGDDDDLLTSLALDEGRIF